ncbi:MAG: hypothetical protein AAGM84_11295 [Pseudomonadota bacterium]
MMQDEENMKKQGLERFAFEKSNLMIALPNQHLWTHFKPSTPKL